MIIKLNLNDFEELLNLIDLRAILQSEPAFTQAAIDLEKEIGKRLDDANDGEDLF